ncbi:MAG: right-handed parallel beta-helix repeat-containing protein [Betaproteobacteria bacterium]|nr:right-handed parallel beta-helix repeat-containing protein [Betaproteobacteria bacterium]
MSQAIFRAALLVLAAALTFTAGAAQRTFVSTSGSDANTASNCSNTAPCRGFSAALTVTDSGGEIIVLSSGGYGPVTIDKSVSIIAPQGIFAGISVFTGIGITIATAGVNVVLKGLSINGLGGFAGIAMTAGDSLVVQNCTISNFASDGLKVDAAARVRILDALLQANYYGAYITGGATALVSGSRFFDHPGAGVYGHASGAAEVTKVEVSRSEASGGGSGFFAYASYGGRIELNVKDSVASRNFSGLSATLSTGTALMSASNNLVSGNTYGLIAGGTNAKIVASGNKVTHNGTGLNQASSGVLQSTGDNTVTDNTTNASGTITGLAKM